MAYNLNTILQQVRNLIGDTSVVSPHFADLTLTDFINRAVEDLSQHFPRRLTHTISTTAGQHSYDLDPTHLQILSVEYPTGQNPPRYLQRQPFTNPYFWSSDRHYDFFQPADSASSNPPRLLVSATPTAGQVITLELTAEHGKLTTGTDSTTVLDRYIHLIGLFVRWKCWQVIASEESMDPDPLQTLLLAQEADASRAEKSYRDALAAAQTSSTLTAPAPWPMDHHDRIY